ncbi:cytochrome P450 [Catenulispora sp. EB89]|uniref:cytochrome P450 family protein n=1 Tax=Catenulispora sp. EB89 TaxID=3156257 RepID=UPI0035153A2B
MEPDATAQDARDAHDAHDAREGHDAQTTCPRHRLDPLGGSPHTNNARWLTDGAAANVLMPGDVPGALVLGHAALKEFLASPDVSKDPANFAEYQQGRVPDGWPLSGFTLNRSMLTADGTEHRRLRSAIGNTFTRGRIKALRPTVEQLVDRLLDQMEHAAAASADGVVDLRTQFALPLPLEVICELLGVPEAARARLHKISSVLVNTDVPPAQVIAATQEMLAVLSGIVADRTEQPQQDLISDLTARAADPALLSPEEVTGSLRSLFIAGHETTMALLMNAVRALSAHPEALDLVRHGKATWAAVVEETLRWDGPVSYFPLRYPTKDLDVAGLRIEAGTAVLAGYSAAGRDPAAYGPDADRFDVTRDERVELLAFGYGPHYCPGAPLARLEAEVALERLYARFPELDLAVGEDQLEYSHTFVGNLVVELPVRLGAARR